MNFGTWLAERRQHANITQRELARRCGLTPAYLAHLENGTSEPPPLKTCKAVARALGISWEETWRWSFAARLKRWLKRQGYSGISDEEMLELVKRIQSKSQ